MHIYIKFDFLFYLNIILYMKKYKNTNICPDCTFENNDNDFTCIICNYKLHKGIWTISNFSQIGHYKKTIIQPYTTIYIHLLDKKKFFDDYYIDKDILFCPISQEKIEKPVKFNNIYYEEEYIQEWLKDNNIDPMTGLECKHKKLEKETCFDYNQVEQYKKYYTYKIYIHRIIIDFCDKKIKFYNDEKDVNFYIKLSDILSFSKNGNFISYQSLKIKFSIKETENIIFIKNNNNNLLIYNIFEKFFFTK